MEISLCHNDILWLECVSAVLCNQKMFIGFLTWLTLL